MKPIKTFIKLSITAFMFVAISCNKEPLPTQTLADTQMENTTELTGHVGYIGERFGGGIIFYINGKHGMIADTVDLAPATWSNGNTNVLTGATGYLIGTGKSNTNKIVAAQGKPGSYAALECKKSKRSGFTDWFLPSLNELQQLHNQQDVIGIGSFTGTYYYTSTESSINTCFLFNWPAGWHDGNFKTLVISVRAIRYY